jgi:hypothetical protein
VADLIVANDYRTCKPRMFLGISSNVDIMAKFINKACIEFIVRVLENDGLKLRNTKHSELMSIIPILHREPLPG